MDKRIPPVGIEDFRKIVSGAYYYVDKTMFIKELLENLGEANLFLRPRRFGKTLALSTLRYFLEDTGDQEQNKKNLTLFDHLCIAEEIEIIKTHATAYPVISITLKGVDRPDYLSSLQSLAKTIAAEYRRHEKMIPGLTHQGLRARFNRISNYPESKEYQIPNQTDCIRELERDFSDSLQLLCEMLFHITGKKAVVLIDEYDVPLEKAYFAGYYAEMVSFIRSLFGSVLKTNNFMEFAVLTGCLRISKESIFTGINHFKIDSLVDNRFGEYFGFTHPEVSELLACYGLSERAGDIEKKYNGYHVGGSGIYNPWSVINAVDRLRTDVHAVLKNPWANTSSNSIIKTLILNADDSVRADIESLISKKSIHKTLYENITYEDMRERSDHIWSFLFYTGYLTTIREDENDEVTLAIPNDEVRTIYRDEILEWFHRKIKTTDHATLFSAALAGDTTLFEMLLNDQLMESMSFFDSIEGFYHGFMLALFSTMKEYRSISNRESGTGRSDLILLPKDRSQQALIFEFKHTSKSNQMESLCKNALDQIKKNRYETEYIQQGYRQFICYGITFYKKQVKVMKSSVLIHNPD